MAIAGEPAEDSESDWEENAKAKRARTAVTKQKAHAGDKRQAKRRKTNDGSGVLPVRKLLSASESLTVVVFLQPSPQRSAHPPASAVATVRGS